MGYEPRLLSEQEVSQQDKRLRRFVLSCLGLCLLALFGLLLVVTIMPISPEALASQTIQLPPGTKVVSGHRGATSGSFEFDLEMPAGGTPESWMDTILRLNSMGSASKRRVTATGLILTAPGGDWESIDYDPKSKKYHFKRVTSY